MVPNPWGRGVEESYNFDVTRILLTTVADPLAQQGAKMSDTITLCTRILLTTQDLHGKKIDHGGSGGVGGTGGVRQTFYSQPGKIDPSSHEAMMLS